MSTKFFSRSVNFLLTILPLRYEFAELMFHIRFWKIKRWAKVNQGTLIVNDPVAKALLSSLLRGRKQLYIYGVWSFKKPSALLPFLAGIALGLNELGRLRGRDICDICGIPYQHESSLGNSLEESP